MTSVAALSDSAVLAAWEAGARASPARRALTLARLAAPDREEELARWSPGRRDALLLDTLVATFGERIDGIASCPDCGEQLELVLGAEDVRAPAPDARADHELVVGETGHRLVFGLPTSGDLVAAAAGGDVRAARLALVESCVVCAELDGREVPARTLPEPAIEALAAAIAELDPQADVRLPLSCPACTRRWSAVFDAAEFLWREVDERAGVLLGEVVALASVFGWSESEILALPEPRRRHYLALVGA